MGRGVASLVAFLCLGTVGACDQEDVDEAYRVTGIVRDDGSGSPLDSVLITAADTVYASFFDRATTGADGRYSVRVGFYKPQGTLSFASEDYVPQRYDIEAMFPAAEPHERRLDVSLVRR